MDRKNYTSLLSLAPAVFPVLLFGVYPLIYCIWLSMQNYSLLDPARGIQFIGGENYLNILSRPGLSSISFVESIWITLIFTGSCLPLELGLGLILATFAFRASRKLTHYVRIFMMVPMLVAPVLVGYTFRYMYEYSFGFFNFILGSVGFPAPRWLGKSLALVSLIIADVWEWIPFSFLVLLAGMCSVPQELMEAASVDGANKWQEFLYIILPQLGKVVLIVLLVRVIELVKTFDLVYVITSGGPGVRTAMLSFNAYLTGFTHFEIGEAAAYAILIVIIINIIVIMFINVLRRR